MECFVDDVKIEEIDRAAAWTFLREDVARRFELARKLSDFETRVIDEADSLGEYAREQDTRTFCILVGSFMEDIFKANFIEQWNIEKKQMADFFGANGPLSTFSQRLVIASGLCWLPSNLQKDAQLLKKIRNEMAHNHRVHALTHEPLLSWANDLHEIEKLWLTSPDGRYATAYNSADLETRLRVRVFSQSMMILSSAMTNPRLIVNALPPEYREEGWEGLTDVAKGLIDVMIRQAYLAFGIPPSEPNSGRGSPSGRK
jgi:DNA-binding MltR family transcriptional regulator